MNNTKDTAQTLTGVRRGWRCLFPFSDTNGSFKRIEQRIEQQPKRIEQGQRKVTKNYNKKKPEPRMIAGVPGQKL